ASATGGGRPPGRSALRVADPARRPAPAAGSAELTRVRDARSRMSLPRASADGSSLLVLCFNPDRREGLSDPCDNASGAAGPPLPAHFRDSEPAYPAWHVRGRPAVADRDGTRDRVQGQQ